MNAFPRLALLALGAVPLLVTLLATNKTLVVVVPAVGRTHTIVRLQTRIRRKDGTENMGGFVFVLDGFLQRDFELWVFCVLD